MRKEKNLLVLLVCVVVFWVGWVYAEPMTLHVPSVSHSTIQGAIDSSSNGDTVIVAPGIYTENINFLGKAITVTSENPGDPAIVANTIIDGGGAGSVVTFATSEGPDSVLSGFTITGGTGTLNDSLGGDIYWGSGVYCWEASPRIKNNVITGNDGTINNVYGGGVGCYNCQAIISNNIIKDNSSYAGGGICVIGGDAEIISNLISDNVADVGGGVVLIGGRLIGNTIVANTSPAGGNIYADVDNDWTNLLINNIIANAIGGQELVWGTSDGYERIRYNNFWNNEGGNYSNIPDQTGLNGNIFADPQFVNATLNDYHLTGNSLCINAGDPDFDVPGDEYDIDGDGRIFAGRVDIGADEYTGFINPRAYAGQDQIVTLKGSTVTLDGSGSFFNDPSGTNEYNWSQVSGPAVVLSDNTAVDPSFDAVEYGSYVFELVVSDGEYDSLPDRVVVTFANAIPVADAGVAQYFSDIPSSVTLDGSGSYDACDDVLTYSWRQTEGPLVQLSDASSVSPTFVPTKLGVYLFELIVNDTVNDSEPDVAGVVIGNHAPVADAGFDRYAATEVVLDGSGSYDPDFYEGITYNWTQVSGPAGLITGADTATPTVSGFTQTSSIQECVFKLVVSDGEMDSVADKVKVKIVPSFGANTLQLRNPPFDPDKPTIVAFGGGNCNTGGSMSFGGLWEEKVNWITASYDKPYSRYGDMLIVYLSSVAPDYKEPIQTMGFSTGNMPAMDVANRMNSFYGDGRYAVNRVSLLDAACRDFEVDINTFVNNPVDGEQCWIDSYIATVSRRYPNVLKITFPGGSHGDPVNWYSSSIYESSYPGGDMYNGGIMGGYYYSVAGPGKNLQLASDTSKYYFKWINSEPDYLTFFDQSLYPGRLPEAVTLAGPADGDTLDAGGAVLSCLPSENAVNYKLLMGPDPYDMKHVISDTPTPPEGVITLLPYETTYWTVKAEDQYGSTIFADPICIKGSCPANPILNPFGMEYLDLIGYELVWEKEISATVSEYCFKMNVKNIYLLDAKNVTVKIGSVPGNISVINGKVFFASLPGGQEAVSDDAFIIRIDHSGAGDEDDLVWEISDESESYLPGDFDKNYMVDFSDLEFLAYNWLRSSVNIGLAGYWPLDGASGDVARDMSGNGNDGIVSGGAEWAPSGGVVNGVLGFDGVDDYVSINDYKGVVGGKSRTVSAWIKTSSAGIIVNWGTSGISGGKWILHLNDTVGWGGDTGTLRVSVGDGRIVGTTDLRDDQWHHVAAVLVDDGSPDVSEVKLYVDGELETVSYIGQEPVNTVSGDDVSIGNIFTGFIDEVRIYNRAFSQEEVQLLYNNPSDDPNHEDVGDLFDLSDLADIAKHWQMQN
ncbi:MAG: hypothetical protein K9M75_11415 [Phycisphaerae bacterium]|nr:hypothetical protein [Phycisphaerae bacterium]